MSESQKRDLVLTEEMRIKLREAGALGFNVEDKFFYIPEAYREKDDNGNFKIPKELCCVFILKSKDGLEAAEAEDNAGYMTYDTKQKESKMFLQSGKSRVQNLVEGILQVKNLYCEDGSKVDFDKEKKMLTITDKEGRIKNQPGAHVNAVIKRMKTGLQLEIANAINERKILTEEELRGLGY